MESGTNCRLLSTVDSSAAGHRRPRERSAAETKLPTAADDRPTRMQRLIHDERRRGLGRQSAAATLVAANDAGRIDNFSGRITTTTNSSISIAPKRTEPS